jgi:hypothetical protein
MCDDSEGAFIARKSSETTEFTPEKGTDNKFRIKSPISNLLMGK